MNQLNDEKGNEAIAIHHQLLEAANTLSDLLTQAIITNGPLILTTDKTDLVPQPPFSQQLCRTIAGQQLSTKAAQSIWNRVIASAGDVPLIEYLTNVEPNALRSCGLSGAKAKAIIGIAHAAQLNQLEAADLSQLSAPERTVRLTALWGIGQWTADMMNIFYFGDSDIWPDGDVTARKTLEKLTSKRRKTEKTAAHFAPYRSYLALHMWHHVDAGQPVSQSGF